ncbi:MAG: indole-3-glycerol phosphate synthase TrpC [Acidimicrobiales bacterium]
MPAYLETILDAHRRQAAEDRRDRDELVDAALRVAAQRPGRGFRAALAQGAARDGVAVIAEVKRRSPSRGDLAPDLEPAAVARAYAAGGAACLSVLTDQAFFGAQPGDLPAARGATDLPVLRKDFTVSEADVCDARLLGADAVLLIVAALSDEELATCSELARRLDLDALVEVHSAVELSRAQAVGATLVGVNQRDLATFAVDRHLAASLADRMGDDVVAVAESGIRGADDVADLVAVGYHGVLVGESLVVAGDRSGAVASLVAAGHRQRTATSEHR